MVHDIKSPEGGTLVRKSRKKIDEAWSWKMTPILMNGWLWNWRENLYEFPCIRITKKCRSNSFVWLWILFVLFSKVNRVVLYIKHWRKWFVYVIWKIIIHNKWNIPCYLVFNMWGAPVAQLVKAHALSGRNTLTPKVADSNPRRTDFFGGVFPHFFRINRLAGKEFTIEMYNTDQDETLGSFS